MGYVWLLELVVGGQSVAKVVGAGGSRDSGRVESKIVRAGTGLVWNRSMWLDLDLRFSSLSNGNQGW